MLDPYFFQDFESILNQEGNTCVSLYMPTLRASSEHEQNRTRYKNCIRSLEKQLETKESPFLNDGMEKARALLENDDFWLHQSDGLAGFISNGDFRIYRLPVSFAELLVTTNRFHIKPLIPLIQNNRQFYLLAISQNRVRLFQCTNNLIEEIQNKDMPGSLDEALALEEDEKSVQFHTKASPVAPSTRSALFHGQGVVEDDHKDRILRFFQQVDETLNKSVPNRNVPLVFAGVDFLFPIYQQANSYSHLVEKSFVPGNIDEADEQKLLQNAWEVIEPYFRNDYEKSKERYQEMKSTEKVSDEVRNIVPAAAFKRVDTLFVALNQHVWGKYDPAEDRVDLHAEQHLHDDDLLDFSASHTIRNGGTVYAVEQEQLPSQTYAAAIYRF